MSTSSHYSQLGLLIPHKTDSVEEWFDARADIFSKDFLHVHVKQYNLQIVQSVSRNELYMVKLIIKGDSTESTSFEYDVPPEIRVSITPQAIVQLPRVDYFPNLVMWQKWNNTQWALFTQ